MPRRTRKRADVLTFADAGTPEANAELWGGVDRVLVVANGYLTERRQEPAGPREIHEHLQMLSDGVAIMSLRTWPLEAAVAFDNLAAIVRSGAYHLRRCRICRLWFLATDRRRTLCYRTECRTTANRARVAKAYAREQAEQKRAADIIRKGTKRPR